jgi:hypothetical protein
MAITIVHQAQMNENFTCHMDQQRPYQCQYNLTSPFHIIQWHGIQDVHIPSVMEYSTLLSPPPQYTSGRYKHGAYMIYDIPTLMVIDRKNTNSCLDIFSL